MALTEREALQVELVEQVRTLWPAMSWWDRWTWADRLKPLYGSSFADTVAALSAPLGPD